MPSYLINGKEYEPRNKEETRVFAALNVKGIISLVPAEVASSSVDVETAVLDVAGPINSFSIDNKIFTVLYPNAKELVRVTNDDGLYEELVRFRTNGDGSCAFHAILGDWDPKEGQIHCNNVFSIRHDIAELIRKCTYLRSGSKLYIAIKAAIQDMVMAGGYNRIASIKAIREKYNTHFEENEKISSVLWRSFENKLMLHTDIITYINDTIPKKMKKHSLRDKFFYCLGEDDGELSARILSVPVLDDAFEQFNIGSTENFNLDQFLTKEVIQDYAAIIEKPGYWLLPCELSIIAQALNIHIDFYTEDKLKNTIIKIDRYSSNNKDSVKIHKICFNGTNHYEQMMALPENNVKHKKRKGSVIPSTGRKKQRLGEELDPLTPPNRQSRSLNIEEFLVSSVSREGSESTFGLLVGPPAITPARHSYKLRSFTKESEKKSWAGALLTYDSSFNYSKDSPERLAKLGYKENILLCYEIIDGDIVIFVNKNQRASTIYGKKQGEHITAYVTLLRSICSMIDYENIDIAPEILFAIAKLLISNKDKLAKFTKDFSETKDKVKKLIFPRNTRKKLTASLRSISGLSDEDAKVVAEINNNEFKSALCFLGLKKESVFNLDFLRNSIKNYNQMLFAQFTTEIGNNLLSYLNLDDLSVLPKLKIPKDEKLKLAEKNKKADDSEVIVYESDRVKKAMLYLKVADRFLLLQKELQEYDLEAQHVAIDEFVADFEKIMDAARGTKTKATFRNNFKGCLKAVTGLDLNINLYKIKDQLDHIKDIKLNDTLIGWLFNDLLDFKAENIRKTRPFYDLDEEGNQLKNGFISKNDEKILFEEPDQALYSVTKKHILILFIIFRNLAKIDAKDNIVKAFLERVIQSPEKTNKNNNDNFQGWGEHDIFDSSSGLVLKDLYEEIKDYKDILDDINSIFLKLSTAKKHRKFP